MEYNLKIGEMDLPVSAELQKEDTLKASAGGEAFSARFRRISANHIHLDVDGRCLNVYTADGPDAKIINIEGTSYWVRDADALAQDPSRRRGRLEGPREITPPMPAVIVRILVSQGDRVEKGQGIIVVSAMKMETTLYAPFAGTVLKINASVGEKVMPGQILVDIEEEPAKPDAKT